MAKSCKKLSVIGAICGECYRVAKCERFKITYLNDLFGKEKLGSMVIPSLRDAQKRRGDVVGS